MKICIISDSHDNRHLMDIAVGAAKEQGAQAVLHCGDIIAPTTLRVLFKHGLPIHAIHGNNAGDLFSMSQLVSEPNSIVNFYGQDAGIDLHGKKIFIVHYPHYARALATTGDWDLVCCGHDHKAQISQMDNIKGHSTLFLNPGTVAGLGAPPTYAMGNLDTMEFEIKAVPIDDAMAYNMPHTIEHD